MTLLPNIKTWRKSFKFDAVISKLRFYFFEQSFIRANPRDYPFYATQVFAVKLEQSRINFTSTVQMGKCVWSVCRRVTSLCFFVSKRTNNTLPFARWANDRRIKENRLGFRFPFETAAYIYVYTVVYSIYILLRSPRHALLARCGAPSPAAGVHSCTRDRRIQWSTAKPLCI